MIVPKRREPGYRVCTSVVLCNFMGSSCAQALLYNTPPPPAREHLPCIAPRRRVGAMPWHQLRCIVSPRVVHPSPENSCARIVSYHDKMFRHKTGSGMCIIWMIGKMQSKYGYLLAQFEAQSASLRVLTGERLDVGMYLTSVYTLHCRHTDSTKDATTPVVHHL